MKEIDAKNQTIGRVATQAATILMGKDSPDYAPNKHPELIVHIVNASKIKIDQKKLDQKKYVSYSGHPGGLKYTPIKKVIAEKGYEEVFRKAVKGMLPKNKLQAPMLKNLKVSD